MVAWAPDPKDQPERRPRLRRLPPPGFYAAQEAEAAREARNHNHRIDELDDVFGPRVSPWDDEHDQGTPWSDLTGREY